MTTLPSPPTSPTSPGTATTTRIRIKPPRRPGSLGNVSYTPGSEGHGERTRSMSPSLSRIVTADPDTPGPENRTTSASVVARKRRQTSITYYTPSSPSPWSQRPRSNRTLSSGVDGPRDGEPVMANGTGNVSQRSSLVLGSRTPSTRESLCSSDGVGAREPLTLVEKHADLLHFIAQKERKCLELRDQLATHEKDLAELKRKWERIVNRGHDPFPNPPPTAGLGGTALDGLKEGVRMIAAGFSDLGGVIQEFDSGDKGTSKPMSLTHAARENNTTSNARRKRPDSEHLSTSSMSSIQESVHTSDRALEGGDGETVTTTVATAPSLSRTGSLNYRMHKRASHVIAKEPTTPTSAFVQYPTQNPKPTNLDVGMSLILTPSPTLVPPLSASVVPTPAGPAPKSPVLGPTHGSLPMTAGPRSSWVDNMGRKLTGLQKGQTFSMSQKRASLLLAGVSNTITSALSPGPTATTPAPAPTLTSISMSTTPRILSSTIPPLTSPVSTKSSLTTLPSSSQSQSRSYPSYKSMTDWLDDDEDEEQPTVHGGGMLLTPDSKLRLPASMSMSVHTTDVEIKRGNVVATATAVTSFDDDDEWNW